MTSLSNTPSFGTSSKQQSTTMTTRKRSRPVSYIEIEDDDDLDTTADAALALALQEQEYSQYTQYTQPAQNLDPFMTNGFEDEEAYEDEVDDDDDEFLEDDIYDVETDDDDDDDSMILFNSYAGPSSSTQPPAKKQRVGRASRGTLAKMRNSRSDGADGAVDHEARMRDLISANNDSAEVKSYERTLKQLSSAKERNNEREIKRLTRKLKKEESRIRARKYRHLNRWEQRKAINRDRLEQNHPNLATMWQTLENSPIIKPVPITQPQAITRKLKSFQLEGVDWMVKQEKTHYKGGLLGDEMGMGKTIQAVSLIMSDYPAKEPTLVVVPPVALMQWASEIKEYTDGRLKVIVYHGTNSKSKNMTIKDLKKFDVIIISYNSLESLYRKETKGWSRGENIVKEASPIHATYFHRLILDEAHSIKTRTTGVAKACFALQGRYKWCLSGTPVQNRIGEFFSLLRFLEIRPFADYFCRSCNCEQLHWSLDDDHMCPHCQHSGAEHVSVFNQELLNPITGDSPTLRQEALSKLHMITARMMLRRLKRDHTSSMVC
jgi:DNA repair protein RAD16